MKNNSRLASNKKANLKYRQIDCYEAGIKLTGSEVKSIKAGRASLDGAYVITRGDEAFVIGMTVPAWQTNNQLKKTAVDRPRKLLLHQKQIDELTGLDQKKGVAIVVFSLYNKNGLIKVNVCTASNKTTRDRRQDIKKRDDTRDLKRQTKYNL